MQFDEQIVGMCWIGVFLRVQFLAKLMTLGAIGLMVRFFSLNFR